MANIFVLGCGFGTALSVLWSKAGHKVTCYSKFPEEIEAIKRDGEHKKLLPGISIPHNIDFTYDISKVAEAEIIVIAVPSKFIGQAAEELAALVPKNTVIVNVSKGFSDCVCDYECESDLSSHSTCRLSQIISVYIPDNPIIVLTGPCHAEEVGRGYPTTVVAAQSNHPCTAPQPISTARDYIQKTLQTKTFRIYTNDDIIGCELGGALKNPIALCCGIASGMGIGDNAAAALMTRGLAEIKRLGTALGAKWQTFTGLAGVGDLIVTCTSKHSRNYRAGFLIGQGTNAVEAVKQIGTVEGYECVKIAVKLAKENNVDVPIFENLYKICYEELPTEKALQELMNRPQRDEREFFWD